ncbi:hypothetical protein JGC18_24820 [Salmonella enterica subsp. enterica serovar Typhimurium]|nr:hypothetical protein [Salmonella enterica subsp. enterica serovar Typhimurium]
MRRALTDRTATSRTLAQELGSVAQQPVSARTIRHRLQQRGLVARRPLLRLPLTLNHERMKWSVERSTRNTEWHDIIFSDESRFCLQHHDGRIRVWRHRGERLYDTCIRHSHSAPSPGVTVWGAIGFDTRTRLVRIASTLNSHRYISDVLEPVVLPYLQDLP